MDSKQQLDELMADQERRMVLAQPLIKQGTPVLTAYIIAGDLLSAERADKMVAGGWAPSKALNYVGSYARFDWAVKNLPEKELFAMLPRLWRGADPDDTNPEYYALWQKAWVANGKETILDDEPLPKGKLTVYRGQIGTESRGISWTLDKKVAETFASSGGGRVRVQGGVILKRKIQSKHVLAYLTERGESEVILTPLYYVGRDV